MIQVEHKDEITVCRVAGTLTRDDYDAAMPEIEHEIEMADRPLRLLIHLDDLRGWEIGALWEDLKFDARHYNDFGRIAVLGDSDVERWGTVLSKPFTGAEVKYFDRDDRADAEAWLRAA